MLTISDLAGIAGNTITLTQFTITTAPPAVQFVEPSGDTSSVSNARILFKFPMDPSSLTVNTSDKNCSGTIQVSSDDFNTCVQMTTSSPTKEQNNRLITELKTIVNL